MHVLLTFLKNHLRKKWEILYLKPIRIRFNVITLSTSLSSNSFILRVPHMNISYKRISKAIFNQWWRRIPRLKLRKINAWNERITLNTRLNLRNMDGITSWTIKCFPASKNQNILCSTVETSTESKAFID